MRQPLPAVRRSPRASIRASLWAAATRKATCSRSTRKASPGVANPYACSPPSCRNPCIGARCSESCTPGARASARGNPRPCGRTKPLCSAHHRASFLRAVCDQETAHRRKCLCDLVVVKGGASPPRGGVGNLRNPCCGRWTRRLIAGVVQLGKCSDCTLEQKGDWGRAQKPEARANSSNAKCAVKVLLAEQIEEPSPRGDGPGARADMPADDLNSNSYVSGALYGLRPAETWGMRPGMEDEHGWITSRFA